MPEKAAPAECRASEELSAILAAQKQAFLAASEPSLAERRRDLARLSGAVNARAEDLASAMNADFGNRSQHESYVAELYTTLSGIRHISRHLGAWMKTERRGVNRVFFPARAEVRARPLGVAGVISPWNYPFYLAMMPVATALAAGNRVMLKPSEFAPATAALMAEILSGLFPPEKVYSACGGPEVGAAFSKLAFDVLLFTGSTGVGRRIMAAASLNLTPVILELGGKSPAIVGPTANLFHAASRIALGKAFNAGQTCVAPDYALVPAESLETFAGAVAAAWRKSFPTLAGNPDYTAIINERHYARLSGLLDDALRKGGRIIPVNAANEKLDPARRKMAPTLVLNASPDMALMQEEIFGPILPVIPYGALSEASAFVNARPRPLALYVFDEDQSKVSEVLSRTLSGGVTVNDVMLHVAQDDLPFGGVGESGMGLYHGREGFDAFSHKQAVFFQKTPNAQGLLRPPYQANLMKILKILLRWG